MQHEQKRVGSYSLTIQRRLAEGGFGLVDLATDNTTQIDVVLKRCYLTRPESFAIANKEIKMLETFTSPYIVKLLASDIQIGPTGAQEALLLLENCGSGHLLDRVNQQGGRPFPINEVYRIFGQLLLALQPMHDYNPPVTHRDLKLENILFAFDENIRLCDFGSCCIGYTDLKSLDAKTVAEEIITKETTQMYRAPEMCDLYMRDVLTEKTDIWALGCIFYAMCFLTHPFQDQGSLGILGGNVKIPNTNSQVGAEAQALLLKMLDLDPEARPNVKEIFNYVRALAKGEPVPVMVLTDEARQWKDRRLEAEKRREAKALKKAKAPIVPARTTTSTALDPNSAAAKRLAMKKGAAAASMGPVSAAYQNIISSSSSTLSSSCSADLNSSAFAFDANFGPSNMTSTVFDANFDEAPKPAFDATTVSLDQSIQSHFENSLPLFETSPAPIQNIINDATNNSFLNVSGDIDLSTLGASSSPIRSLNSSLDNSLIDLDF